MSAAESLTLPKAAVMLLVGRELKWAMLHFGVAENVEFSELPETMLAVYHLYGSIFGVPVISWCSLLAVIARGVNLSAAGGFCPQDAGGDQYVTPYTLRKSLHLPGVTDAAFHRIHQGGDAPKTLEALKAARTRMLRIVGMEYGQAYRRQNSEATVLTAAVREYHASGVPIPDADVLFMRSLPDAIVVSQATKRYDGTYCLATMTFKDIAVYTKSGDPSRTMTVTSGSHWTFSGRDDAPEFYKVLEIPLYG